MCCCRPMTKTHLLSFGNILRHGKTWLASKRKGLENGKGSGCVSSLPLFSHTDPGLRVHSVCFLRVFLLLFSRCHFSTLVFTFHPPLSFMCVSSILNVFFCFLPFSLHFFSIYRTSTYARALSFSSSEYALLHVSLPSLSHLSSRPALIIVGPFILR